jgi:nitrate reductase NapE component
MAGKFYLVPRLLIGERHVLDAAVNGAAAAIAFISFLLLAVWLWSVVAYGL